jgi:hypothetical protein
LILSINERRYTSKKKSKDPAVPQGIRWLSGFILSPISCDIRFGNKLQKMQVWLLYFTTKTWSQLGRRNILTFRR